jgi:hypothetical protein
VLHGRGRRLRVIPCKYVVHDGMGSNGAL